MTKKVKKNVVIECSETPEITKGLEKLYLKQPDSLRRETKYHISQHRLAKTAIRLGIALLDGKNTVEVRELMSELAPARKKYWDEEAQEWL